MAKTSLLSLFLGTLLFLLVQIEPSIGQLSQQTCYYDENSQSYYIKEGLDTTGIAWGSFYEEIQEKGWHRLYIEANPKFQDQQQAFCAGFVEGSLTAEAISMWYQSIMANVFQNQSMSEKLTTYLQDELSWTRQMAMRHEVDDPYWNHVGLVLAQFDGLVDGYKQYKSNDDVDIDELGMYQMNAAGDMETLIGLFQGIEYKGKDLEGLDCSGFVKVTSDLSELYFGHTTWTYYYSMIRIFKYYTLPYQAAQTSAKVMAFSSRPAFLSSKDDFLITDSQLAIMETTNGVSNSSLFQYVVPTTVLTWVRSIVATRMASTARDWTKIFAKHNSGTYNNQWMVVDYKMFTPGQAIQPNTLWILEQIPGYTQSADVSNILSSQSYWPSYNVPYFIFIYNISGYSGGGRTDGSGYEYTHAPRAAIFELFENDVQNLTKMRWMMQYDNPTDPVTQHNPTYAISSRYDLISTKPAAFGGVDSKVTSNDLIQSVSCWAISGPTHQSLPPFEWTAEWNAQYFHEGLPTVWNFDWEQMQQV